MYTQRKERVIKLRTRSSPRAHSATKNSRNEFGSSAVTCIDLSKDKKAPQSVKVGEVQSGLSPSCRTQSGINYHVSNQNIHAKINETLKHAGLNKLKDCWTHDRRPADDCKRQLRSDFSLDEKLKNKPSISTTSNVLTDSKVDLPVSTARRKIAFDIENHDEIKNFTESRCEPTDKINEQIEGEEYVPRRKKLRSEVTDEELWEGFQTVRFKRLTPIKLRSERTELDNCPKQSSIKTMNESFSTDRYDKIPSKIEKRLLTRENKTEGHSYSRIKTNECREILGTKIDIRMEARGNENCYNKTKDYKRSSRGFAELCKEFLNKDSTLNDKSVKKTKSDHEINKKHKLKRPTLCDYLDISNTTLSFKKYLKAQTLSINDFSENIAKFKNDKKIREKTKSNSLLTDCLQVSQVGKTNYKPNEDKTVLSAARVNTPIESATVGQNYKEAPVTPKRSARLQEKRENAPTKYQSNADYVYTPLKRPEEPLKSQTVHKSRKSTDCNSTSCKDEDDFSEIGSKNVKDSGKTSEISALHVYDICAGRSSDKLTGSSNSNESAKSRKNDSSQPQLSCERPNPPVKRNDNIQSDSLYVSKNSVPEVGSLKIRVRKTESGASIISSVCHSTNSDESTDDTSKIKLTKYTRPAPCDHSKSETPKKRVQKKKKNLNKQKTPNLLRLERKDPPGDNQIQEDEVSPKKQTRSRTRSGEGGITLACADPEAGLKQPRNRGKVHPSELKSSKNNSKASKSKKRRTNEKTEFPTGHTSSPRIATRQKSKDLEEEHLLKLPIIGKYACLLWSSENKRHFQQVHPDSSSAEVDEYMRQAWQKMTDKETVKYYQRAFSATREENRHSNRKCKSQCDTKADPITPCRSMVKFLAFTPVEQNEELRKWLRFVHEVSPEEYSRLVNGFKEILKRDTSQGKEMADENTDKEGLHHRKLLFQKVLDVRGKVIDIYHQKKAKQKELVKDAFGFLVKRLISGEEVKFTDEQHSERLASVLIDLRNLENEFRVTVSGEPLISKSYENLLEHMQESENEVASTYNTSVDILAETDIPEEETLFFKQYLDQMTEKELPALDLKDVVCFFDDIMATLQEDASLTSDVLERLSNYFDQSAALNFKLMTNGGYGSCCELNSPSCILTNWLVSEQFKQLSQGNSTSYRNNKTLIDCKFLTPFMENQLFPKSKSFNTSRCKPVCENFVNVNKNNNINANVLESASRVPLPPTASVDQSPAGIGTISKSESFNSRYKHSLIQRKIHNVHGQTLVRYTSTPIANDKSGLFQRFSKFNSF